MKKLFFTFALLLFSFILIVVNISCTQNKQVGKRKVYLLLKTSENPFFQDIQKGVMENLMNKYELQVRSGKNESDIKMQLEVLQSIIVESRNDSTKVAGVIITPTSSGSDLIPLLKELHDRKIPIVIVDTKIDSMLMRSVNLTDIPFIGSSNFIGGKQAAYEISQKYLGGGKILILKGVEGQETAQQRFQGFMSVIDSLKTFENKNFQITVRTANWRRSEANKIVTDLYSFGDKFNAIFASNDEMGLGSYQALIDLGVEQMPTIIGFDAIDEARLAIQKKIIFASIAQNPYRMGKESIQLIDKLISGDSINVINLIPTEVIK